MRLIPSEPVTIDRVRYGERWFPRIFRHSDGTLLLYVEYGHDRNFAPDFRLQSSDNGQTWHTPTDNVPRTTWCHSFADDGTLWEIDAYSVHDPKTKHTGVYFGAWSDPGTPSRALEKGYVRVHAPSLRNVPLTNLQRGGAYPTFHWWPLWNMLHGKEELSGAEVNMRVLYFTSTIDLPNGSVLALAYGITRDIPEGRNAVLALVSSDRGRNWTEIGNVAYDDSTTEGVNEASVVRLKDGRLYAVMRTGTYLVHAWSRDDGSSWTRHEKLTFIDEPGYEPGMAWPQMTTLGDGTLILVYGRPGKNMVFDPTGTGTGWRGRLDLHAHELQTQARAGVPPEVRLRGKTHLGIRYWDSGDYLSVVPVGSAEMLVVYDVHSYVESWNAMPYEGVRMVKVRLER